MAIFAPCVRDVEVVAHQGEAARDVQRVRGRRWIEEERMYLARGAVVLEDADVVDAVPRFSPITDPPHGSVLLNTIVALSEPARDDVRFFSQQQAARRLRPAQLDGAPGIISRGLLRVFVTANFSGHWLRRTPVSGNNRLVGPLRDSWRYAGGGGRWALGVESEISSSSGVMSIATSAKSGVLR